MKKIFAIMLMLIFASFAEDYVVINSQDGRDVLSGIYYANVKDLPVKFMPSSGYAADVFAVKTGVKHDILLIQSSDMPLSGFIETELRARNHTLEVYSSSDGEITNRYLAERADVDKFIVVDSAYSDSALSVLPYAAKKGAYVLLADKYNIEEISEIVTGAEEIIVYGLVDQEVEDALEPYNPEIIGKGEDKYEDNVELVGRTMSEFGDRQIIVADGTFVEEGMADGTSPILFSGRLIPTVTFDFLKDEAKNDRLGTVLLIGDELVMPIYDARERIEIALEKEGTNESFGITVKFGQVVPSASSSVIELDKFYLPSYQPEINISELVYNKISKTIMIAIENTGEGASYYTMDIHVYADGSEFSVFGSNETKLIERGDSAGAEYALDLSSVEEGNITATAIVKYGASKYSLDSYASKTGPIEEIEYIDESNVTAESASYNREEQVVKVTLKNNGEVTAYEKTELVLVLEGEELTVKGAGTKEIDPKSLLVEEFPIELTEEDLQANQNITAQVTYGARSGFLVKEGIFLLPLSFGSEFPWWMLLVLLAVIIAAYFLKRKMERKA